MPIIDANNVLGFAKTVRTDTAATDAAEIEIPVRGSGYRITHVTVYNASGDNTLATLGVFGAAGGAAPIIVADAALGATHAASTGVSERTVAATALTPAVTADSVFVRVGTASGVSGSTVDVVVHGYALP